MPLIIKDNKDNDVFYAEFFAREIKSGSNHIMVEYLNGNNFEGDIIDQGDFGILNKIVINSTTGDEITLDINQIKSITFIQNNIPTD